MRRITSCLSAALFSTLCGAANAESPMESSRAMHLEDADATTNYVKLAAPDALDADYSFILPETAGADGEILTSNGDGTLAWTAPLDNNPMDSEGDMIVGGTDGELAKLDSGTPGKTLVATGAASPEWKWGNSRSGSDAYTVTDTDGFDTFILTGSTDRTITLPSASNNSERQISFINHSSAVLTITRSGSDAIGPDSETSILLSFGGDSIRIKSNGSSWLFVGPYFQSATVNAMFAMDGTGSPGNTTAPFSIQRIGNLVTVFMDSAFQATAGTGSIALVGSSVLPTWARPATAFTQRGHVVRNNGAVSGNELGSIAVATNGTISISRDRASTPYTNNQVGGLNDATTFSFLKVNP